MAALVVLGSAQDGGLPHIGCRCRQCERARREPKFRRLPASVGVVSGGRSLLIDATNAFEEQIERLARLREGGAAGASYPPPDVIALTHAHTGHYVGLWQLDRSTLATRGLPVRATPKLCAHLAANQPWAWMLADGFITLELLELDYAAELLPGVRVTPLAVPHRAEWDVDTIGLLIEGPQRRAFYLPDIDAWSAWQRDIREVAAGVDIAIIDGCFWEPFHIPGVPHPPICESLDLLQPIVDAGRTQVVFTHLNHSNPAADPGSAESAEIARRGFRVAREGDVFSLIDVDEQDLHS